MNRAFTIFGVAVVPMVLGGTCVNFLTKTPRPAWIQGKSDGEGYRFTSAALNDDIPWPKTMPPSGRVKFLKREKVSNWVMRSNCPLDLTQHQHYQKSTAAELRMITVGKLDRPSKFCMRGISDFTLKDADGFELTKISGPTEYLSANSDNVVQGTTEETLPSSVINDTKEVDVSFLVTSCNPCNAK